MSTDDPRIAGLERNFDHADAFERPPFAGVHTPTGLYSTKPNHPSDCLCETGKGEFWLQADTVMKWRSP